MTTKIPETEAGFFDAIHDLALATGWDEPYHTHDSRHSAAGFPDVALARRGLVVFLELKVGKGRPSVDQYRWITRFRSAAIPAAVVWPRDWPAIEKLLTRRVVPREWTSLL